MDIEPYRTDLKGDPNNRTQKGPLKGLHTEGLFKPRFQDLGSEGFGPEVECLLLHFSRANKSNPV